MSNIKMSNTNDVIPMVSDEIIQQYENLSRDEIISAHYLRKEQYIQLEKEHKLALDSLIKLVTTPLIKEIKEKHSNKLVVLGMEAYGNKLTEMVYNTWKIYSSIHSDCTITHEYVIRHIVSKLESRCLGNMEKEEFVDFLKQ